MANLEVSIPHNLTQDEAVSRIKNLLTETRNTHNDKISDLREDWNGYVGDFSFTAQGFDISGILTVTPSSVELKGKIPFALSLFKGQIAKIIYDQASKILS
jgi:Putative polyhydroxyalkanoic acid system protein (PHA_gran_rgn)